MRVVLTESNWCLLWRVAWDHDEGRIIEMGVRDEFL